MCRIVFNKRASGIGGFTLIELILSMLVMTAIFGITAQTMMSSSDSMSFISNRKTVIADVRYGVNKMTQELRLVDSAKITNISSTQIDFSDSTSNTTNYRLATDGSRLAIYRGSEVLIPNVATFTLEYQDGDGNVLSADSSQIANIRRIKLEVTTEPIGDEQSMTVSTLVVPRSFVGYTNYQQ